MVEGGMKKFFAEVALNEQKFIVDPSKTVKEVAGDATIKRSTAGKSARARADPWPTGRQRDFFTSHCMRRLRSGGAFFVRGPVFYGVGDTAPGWGARVRVVPCNDGDAVWRSRRGRASCTRSGGSSSSSSGRGSTSSTPHGNPAAYSHQKAFKLREDITLYTDESKSDPMLKINTNSVLDFSGTYDVTTPEGLRLGRSAGRA
jgi:hypothetical protein